MYSYSIILNILIFMTYILYTTLVQSIIIESKGYCEIKDPMTSYFFNLYGLSSYEKDSIIRFEDKISYIRVHFCQYLLEPCNGKSNYGVCLHRKDGQQIGIGKEPPKIDFRSGKILVNYYGDQCNSTHNYKIQFEMKCDFAMENGVAVDMDSMQNEDQCDFLMFVWTAKACAKKKVVKCTVNEKFNHYNLGPLTDFSKNYKIEIDANTSVILNVCHSLIYGEHYADCNSDTAICLMDTRNKTDIRYKNLGKLENSHIVVVNGNLKIDYKHGALCDEPSSNESRKMRSTIIFICDLNATDTLPEYIGGSEVCHYKFVWKTMAACSQQYVYKEALLDKKEDCSTRNPLTNIEYDLSFLTNKTLKSRQIDGDYEFSICGPLKDKVCPHGSGVCRTLNGKTYGISGGMANRELMWKESGPYLNYTDGDICLDDQKMYTIISFICGEQDELDVEEKTCYININWTTHIVCKKACAVPNDEINFERLIGSSKNYLVKINGSNYYVYACRSLIPEQFSNCPFGVGICTVKAKNANGTKDEIILGYPEKNPVVSNRSVTLLYKNGSICQEDKSRRISSKISFLCNFDISHGRPMFKYYKDCTYYFQWKTQMACGKVEATLDKNCSLTNALGDNWNLTALQKTSVQHVIKDKQAETYHINICGEGRFCKDSFICDDNMNYGNKMTVSTDYANNVIKLKFSNGSKCPDGSHAQSILNIKCNKASDVGKPVLVWEQYCGLEFEWITNVSCKVQYALTSIIQSEDENAITTPNKRSPIEGKIIGIAAIISIIVILSIALLPLSSKEKFCRFFSNLRLRIINYWRTPSPPGPSNDIPLS